MFLAVPRCNVVANVVLLLCASRRLHNNIPCAVLVDQCLVSWRRKRGDVNVRLIIMYLIVAIYGMRDLAR